MYTVYCMKESFAQQCLNLLKREDVKHEFKTLLSPVLECIWYELKPYIYILMGMVFAIFVMMLAILILLVLSCRSRT